MPNSINTYTQPRRFTDYIKLIIITVGILFLISSAGLVMQAQSSKTEQGQAQFADKVKDIQEQQKSDLEKITSIDKRLVAIETKQDIVLYILAGVGGAIGMLLGERIFSVVFAANRRR